MNREQNRRLTADEIKKGLSAAEADYKEQLYQQIIDALNRQIRFLEIMLEELKNGRNDANN